MEGEPRPVEDFNEVFKAFNKSSEPILLVGGHAVNVWALSYYDRAASEIAPHEPLTSSDMDIFATRSALVWLGRELGSEVRFAGPREIVLGAMEILIEGRPFLLEGLRSLKGVTAQELEGRASLEVGGCEILVPLPHVLLKAKLANALDLDQSDRQDVKHVNLLAIVLREYLRDLLGVVTEGSERDILAIIRKSVSVAMSWEARRFGEIHSVAFEDYLPIGEMRNATRRLSSFAGVEFPKRYKS